MTNRKLPKSLHTITALVNVARDQISRQPAGESELTAEAAAKRAAIILGIDQLDDVYGLIDKAAKQI